jgi:RNA polymerase sigma factor (sigma-70 family)
VQEDEIAERLRAGGKAQEGALKELYRTAAPAMLRFFVHMGASPDGARDILQATMVKIVRGIHTFQATGSAKAWFWQVGRNCLMDYLRKQQALAEHEVLFDDEGWERLGDNIAEAGGGALRTTIEDCVSRAISNFAATMPDRAFVLTLQMEGHSIDVIAIQIGRTIAATKEYLSQCRKKLRPFMAHCVELMQDDAA